jgi:hypothetical protein
MEQNQNVMRRIEAHGNFKFAVGGGVRKTMPWKSEKRAKLSSSRSNRSAISSAKVFSHS